MSIEPIVYFVYVLYRVFLRLLLGKKKRSIYSKNIPFYSDLAYAVKRDFREDYDTLYGQFNYHDKTVLDIGADYGSTATFFLIRGAKRVYAIEGNLVLFKRLRENAKKDRRIHAFHVNISSAKKFTSLFRLHPDIIKVDCEGCEKHLLDIENDVFRSVKEYVIETHTKMLYNKFMKKFSELDYAIQVAGYISPQVTTFYAVKGDNIP